MLHLYCHFQATSLRRCSSSGQRPLHHFMQHLQACLAWLMCRLACELVVCRACGTLRAQLSGAPGRGAHDAHLYACPMSGMRPPACPQGSVRPPCLSHLGMFTTDKQKLRFYMRDFEVHVSDKGGSS